MVAVDIIRGMRNRNITLIGMPGAGKSYLGKRLAEKFDMDWVDLDVVSYSAVGGDEEFLRREEVVLLGVDGERIVISPGGSCIYSEKGMLHLKDISFIVYLRLPRAILEERLGDYSGRGVVRAKRLSFEELYEERAPLYELYADCVVDCRTDSLEEQFQLLCGVVTDL